VSERSAIESARTHKIANGDNALINVRFGPDFVAEVGDEKSVAAGANFLS
jgi:hypothetical protein